MNKLNGLLSPSKRKDNARTASPSSSDVEKSGARDAEPFHLRILRLRILAMVLIVSLGGLIFGYDTGQISGFVAMSNFLNNFADEQKGGKPAFSNSREGTIVGLVCRSSIPKAEPTLT